MTLKPALPAWKGVHLPGEATHCHSWLNITHSGSLTPATPQGEPAINAASFRLPPGLWPPERGHRHPCRLPSTQSWGLQRGRLGVQVWGWGLRWETVGP